MSEEIIKILDDLGNRFGIVIDWSSQNIVPYLQDLTSRFIALQNTKAIIWIVLLSFGITVTTILMIKGIISAKQENDEDLMFASVGIGIVIIICFLLPLILNIFGLAQNIFTPELTILEYVKNISTSI